MSKIQIVQDTFNTNVNNAKSAVDKISVEAFSNLSMEDTDLKPFVDILLFAQDIGDTTTIYKRNAKKDITQYNNVSKELTKADIDVSKGFSK